MKLRVGQRLLAVREDRNMTQLDMAELLDVPLATYARYERNETPVEFSKLAKFAEKLNITIQELLPETVAITNNNSGQGGSVVFGNQNVYIGDSIVNQALSQENKELRERLALLEQKINEILKK